MPNRPLPRRRHPVPTHPRELRRERFGMAAAEAGHLRRAAVRAVDGLSYRQLALVGVQLWHCFTEAAPLLGLDPDTSDLDSAPATSPPCATRH